MQRHRHRWRPEEGARRYQVWFLVEQKQHEASRACGRPSTAGINVLYMYKREEAWKEVGFPIYKLPPHFSPIQSVTNGEDKSIGVHGQSDCCWRFNLGDSDLAYGRGICLQPVDTRPQLPGRTTRRISVMFKHIFSWLNWIFPQEINPNPKHWKNQWCPNTTPTDCASELKPSVPNFYIYTGGSCASGNSFGFLSRSAHNHVLYPTDY